MKTLNFSGKETKKVKAQSHLNIATSSNLYELVKVPWYWEFGFSVLEPTNCEVGLPLQEYRITMEGSGRSQ